MHRTSRKRANPAWGWRVGACLLSPYSVPPQPPFEALREGAAITDQEKEALLRDHADDPAFAGLATERLRFTQPQLAPDLADQREWPGGQSAMG